MSLNYDLFDCIDLKERKPKNSDLTFDQISSKSLDSRQLTKNGIYRVITKAKKEISD